MSAYESLSAKNPNNTPTIPEIMAEIQRMFPEAKVEKAAGDHMVGKRTYPNFADKYLSEDAEKSDYPDPIGKSFKPKKHYPKKKRKITTTVNLTEDELTPEENPELTDAPEVNAPQGEMDGTNDLEQLAQDKEEQGEVLVGGKGDGKSPLEFDANQVLMGLEVEKEHASDPLQAIEIVLDHLSEDPEYYTQKDNPEDSAQFGASSDTSGEDADGNVSIGMNVPNGDEDKESTDILLGYKPHNVGDEVEESDVNEELDFFDEKKRNISLVPIQTQRDKRGFRLYHDKDDTNIIYAEKDGVLYDTDEMGKPTTSHRMSKIKVNGLVDDSNLPVDKLSFEKQGIRNVEKSFGIDESNDLEQNDPPTWHQIQIAKKTMKMPGAMANVMGGMSKEEAQRILSKRGLKNEVQMVGSTDTTQDDGDSLNKYSEYSKKDFNTLGDNDKEEYFKLWQRFKDVEK
jgi:hypothetical protein